MAAPCKRITRRFLARVPFATRLSCRATCLERNILNSLFFWQCVQRNRCLCSAVPSNFADLHAGPSMGLSFLRGERLARSCDLFTFSRHDVIREYNTSLRCRLRLKTPRSINTPARKVRSLPLRVIIAFSSPPFVTLVRRKHRTCVT